MARRVAGEGVLVTLSPASLTFVNTMKARPTSRTAVPEQRELLDELPRVLTQLER